MDKIRKKEWGINWGGGTKRQLEFKRPGPTPKDGVFLSHIEEEPQPTGVAPATKQKGSGK